MAFKRHFRASRRHRGPALVLSLATLLTFAGPVSAEDMEAERTRARAHMAEGRARQSAKDLPGALESFRAADSLLHFPTTGLEVARAEADLGLLLESRHTLRSLLDVRAPPDELPQFKKARVLASGLLVEIERTIPTMRMMIMGAPAGAAVAIAIDGVSIAPALATAPQALNPGHHLVVASSAFGEAKQEVDLAAHEMKELTLTLRVTSDAPSSAERTKRAAAPPSAAPPGDAGVDSLHRTKTDHTLAFLALGAASVGATVSVIAGLSSLSHTRSAEAGCVDGRCPPSTHDDLHRAHTFATVANVGLIVAGAGLGLGIVSLLFAPEKPNDGNNAPRPVTPWVGLGALGIDGKF